MINKYLFKIDNYIFYIYYYDSIEFCIILYNIVLFIYTLVTCPFSQVTPSSLQQ